MPGLQHYHVLICIKDFLGTCFLIVVKLTSCYSNTNSCKTIVAIINEYYNRTKTIINIRFNMVWQYIYIYKNKKFLLFIISK